MQRLQIQLLHSLGRHELHRRALHGFGNRFGIMEVVLLSPAIGADIFGRHQPGIVTQRCEFAAQVMGADAGCHADQARRYIGEPRFHLATRPLLPQHDGAARIVAHGVERVLADIDADHGDRSIGCLRHGVLLVCGAPCQLIAGGAGARPDHPISGPRAVNIVRLSTLREVPHARSVAHHISPIPPRMITPKQTHPSMPMVTTPAPSAITGTVMARL